MLCPDGFFMQSMLHQQFVFLSGGCPWPSVSGFDALRGKPFRFSLRMSSAHVRLWWRWWMIHEGFCSRDMFIIRWNTHKLTKDHQVTVTITSMQDFIVHANWKTGEVRSGSASTAISAIPVRPSGHSYYSWRLVILTRWAQPNWPMLPMLVRLPSVLIRFLWGIQYHGSIQTWCIKFAAVAVIFLKAVISLIHIPSYNYTNINQQYITGSFLLDAPSTPPSRGLRMAGVRSPNWSLLKPLKDLFSWTPANRPTAIKEWTEPPKWRKLSGTSPCIDSFDFFLHRETMDTIVWIFTTYRGFL